MLFVRLPAFLLAYSRYTLFRSLYHLSFSRSLSLSVSWPRPYLPALSARWDNDGHLVNCKHRFSLRLYRARQGKGKSREILLTYLLIFEKFVSEIFVFFYVQENCTFIMNNYYSYFIVISCFGRCYRFTVNVKVKR